MKKRMVSILLAALMLLTLVPVTVMAKPVPQPTAYCIMNIMTNTFGNVTVDREGEIEIGATVTITATPKDGYKLKSLEVKDINGGEIPVITVNETTYIFEMPSKHVGIYATFEESVEEKEDSSLMGEISALLAVGITTLIAVHSIKRATALAITAPAVANFLTRLMFFPRFF